MTTYSHFFWSYLLARGRSWRWSFALGSVVSDVVYFPLMIRTVVEHGLASWGDLALWDAAAAHPATVALHSYVPAGAALVPACALRQAAVVAALAGVLCHAFVDMLTHVSDAYPVFWPLSDFRFPTPVSYYEAAYHGELFFLAEHGTLIAALLLLALRSMRRRWWRGTDAVRRSSRPGGRT